MYIHIPKEKRTKLDPSGKKGIFVGYSKSSKAYRIYFPGFKKIDINRDVTFDEDSSYIKSRKKPAEEPEEEEAPRIHDTSMNEETQEEDQEFEEPQRHVDPPQEKNPHKRKPAWVRKIIKVQKDMGFQKRISEKEREPDPVPVMYLYYVTLLIKNLPSMKKRQNIKNGRMR